MCIRDRCACRQEPSLPHGSRESRLRRVGDTPPLPPSSPRLPSWPPNEFAPPLPQRRPASLRPRRGDARRLAPLLHGSQQPVRRVLTGSTAVSYTHLRAHETVLDL